MKRSLVFILLILALSVAPHQAYADERVYLPVVAHGKSELIHLVEIDEDLPPCADVISIEEDPGPPDLDDYTGDCLMKSETVGVEGWPLAQVMQQQMQSDEARAAATFTNSDAHYHLNCYGTSGCNQQTTGMRFVAANFSSRIPTGPTNWADYVVTNRVQFVQPLTVNITCQNGGAADSMLALGVGYGFLMGQVINGSQMKVYWQDWNHGACNNNATNIFVDPDIAVLMRMYMTSYDSSLTFAFWKGEIWTGQWTVVFQNVQMPYTYMPRLYAGSQLWAKNGDKSTVNWPLNFIHKSVIADQIGAGVPWGVYTLPSALNNKTSILAESPYRVYDLIGGEYTSISYDIP